MAGLAVWARGGRRDRYAPLASRLCQNSDPVALAGRFRDDYGAETLYIADLDAIAGHGDNRPVLEAIAKASPELELWIDAGLGDRTTLARFLRQCPGRPVIGSETLVDAGLLAAAPDAVLSLDYRDSRLLGPTDLLRAPQQVPRDLILMSLHRVGTGMGPDLDLLDHIGGSHPHCRSYAAGGVRDAADLELLCNTGAAGVLLATALHDGRISASAAAQYSERF